MKSLAAAGSPGGANAFPFRAQIPKSPRFLISPPRPPLFPTHHLGGERRGANSRRRLFASSSDGPITTPSSNPLVASAATGPSSSGLYSAKVFELTAENVNLVLDDVRPYLIADGGNVDVVSVEDGIISLKLQGACGSCPSSTTTMKMGIERVLKEKFGEAIKDICQAVNNHLEMLRPAIRNFGGNVEVISVEGGDCHVRYVGPDSIGTGIKAAIKERFPDIVNIVFSD
ncbi:NifU-like protein 1, chloroplastic [Cocos nucifera]|uniref:NifU-like protein 1, chloroplastic n=1 Tax=Cocos nucifera TaxID=13894 RepID=A0A8K0NDL1_COCNU|nr:NifU-like protein 1, chloroplastic [Cocos nucifera]KAG1371390.1 NifU-like protein 1, chloroplastic [Cocos nucifera]